MVEKPTRGALVKARRNELGLSQNELAGLVGVSRGTIRNIEADLVEPNKATWVSLDRVLGNTEEQVGEPSTEVGDRVEHDSYGQGVVVAHGQGSRIRVDFGAPHGEKDLVLKYAPAELVEEEETGGSETSRGRPEADPSSVPGEIAEVLMSGPVIDYEVFHPKEGDGIAVVTMLVKTTDARLSRRERRYISEVWDRLADSLHADPDSEDVPEPEPEPAAPQRRPEPVTERRTVTRRAATGTPTAAHGTGPETGERGRATGR
ncbi:helix-turn-helix transcriptional regulator [Nocardiopsis sp. N85]|uniref:helix-turn-helix domain-containing protein n=1 Tax=Nocardiopsis sp. N85 TaxID=3029400 RepID=UPI00237F6CA2|nr:helix-turn-helix transcriptional regulator [Nocardiopsis sp. N85]MDE3724476.1 helix-turn-helix transcriptional regulator [Nocardiopsis sp. N85]